MFDPVDCEKYDPDRLSRLTTWSQGGNFELDCVAPYDESEPQNKIDFLFNAVPWDGTENPSVYIGVYNTKPEEGPVNFTI